MNRKPIIILVGMLLLIIPISSVYAAQSPPPSELLIKVTEIWEAVVNNDFIDTLNNIQTTLTGVNTAVSSVQTDVNTLETTVGGIESDIVDIQNDLDTVIRVDDKVSGSFVSGPAGGTWTVQYYGDVKHVSLSFYCGRHMLDTGFGAPLGELDQVIIWATLPSVYAIGDFPGKGPVLSRIITIDADSWTSDTIHVEFDTTSWMIEVTDYQGRNTPPHLIIGSYYCTATGTK
jgi:hypothetical protein